MVKHIAFSSKSSGASLCDGYSTVVDASNDIFLHIFLVQVLEKYINNMVFSCKLKMQLSHGNFIISCCCDSYEL